MKYVIAALVVCMLAGAGVAFWDVLVTAPAVDPSPVAEAAVQDSPERATEGFGESTNDCATNTAPRIRVSVDCQGLECRFDASATSDDRGVHAWRWSFGDAEAAAAIASHSFPADGHYEVGLAAIDSCGLADFRKLAVDVAAGEHYGCVGCLETRPATPATAVFPRGNSAQDAAHGRGRESRRFSGGTAQPSPEGSETDDPQPVPAE